jgi:hypothetical protein
MHMQITAKDKADVRADALHMQLMFDLKVTVQYDDPKDAHNGSGSENKANKTPAGECVYVHQQVNACMYTSR